jgi:hypothetical protein
MMKVVDFSGYEHPWPPKSCEVDFNDVRPRSELHTRCRTLLRAMYPTQPILEEVPIPAEQLFCDFYLPMRRVVVECHGEQHYKYVPHFHGDRVGFLKSKTRDKKKAEWCALNNIRLISLPYNETDGQWKQRIIDAEGDV